MTKKRNRRNKRQLPNKKELVNLIAGIFSNNPNKLLNYKQLAKQLLISDASTKLLITDVLHQLTEEEFLEEIYTGKFKLKSKGGYILGKVDMTSTGSAYIISDDIEEDVFVSQSNLKKALHGDTVKVYCYARKRSYRIEGEVVEIIDRARTNFVGVVEVSQNFAFLIPDNKKMPHDIFIPRNKLKGIKNGQKAVVKIAEWPEKAKNPIGEIVDVLGDIGDNNVEMNAILAEFDLPYHFPEKVNRAAKDISSAISKNEIANRKDFRLVNTFTIDPVDAKDFDDALSFRILKNGNFEIGVHIADVTHYVGLNSIIEKEALNRATSVYLVDRVVPMLPEKLSNDVCSLNPNVDKLCFSVVFEIDNNAVVKNSWIGRTIINSDKRFNYGEAQEIIDKQEGVFSKELIKLNEIAQMLRNERFKNGAISFERTEIKFNLDEKGKPLGIAFKEHGLSNQLVEEFMLLANKTVASFIAGKGKTEKHKKTFVYRIHDKPDRKKLNAFAYFIKRFGYKIEIKNDKQIASSINKLLDDVEGKKEQDVVENLAIRTMAKAKYSVHNIGHYGLAFAFYTHFTSPIRRYPDMMVHRLLQHYLDGGKAVSEKKYEKMCQHSSLMEQKAAEAERASVKYKQVEFLQSHVGEKFEGIISGVTEWGLYVEIIENKCEGMVSIRELDDDFYFYDEENYSLIGRHTKNRYQMGDKVRIEIKNANLTKKQLDFVMVD
ncbi:MAG: ribonuclease R [Chlorobi bacterium]|nr:ribonuclease R [Chlorobiota bacterium]